MRIVASEEMFGMKIVTSVCVQRHKNGNRRVLTFPLECEIQMVIVLYQTPQDKETVYLYNRPLLGYQR